jgi:flagellar basal-body rod protein FlgF
MNYGLYLSATGVIANSYRQDVIANNLANAETSGFKRDLALFQERPTEARTRGGGFRNFSDPLLERLGGGAFASPTLVDQRQGEFEPTGKPLDVAIQGTGYFAVSDGTTTYLTRNGEFSTDRTGKLVLATDPGLAVMDPRGRPITLRPGRPTFVARDGTVTQDQRPAGRIGVFDVPDRTQLTKQGGTLFANPTNQPLQPGAGLLRSEAVERANVDPAAELAELMDTQRQLEANANMIRCQDQTLSRLVNEVGKIG